MCSYTLVSILLLVVALSGNPTAALDKRIENGTTAIDGQYPYLVSLRSNGEHWFGGSILNTRWILTSPYFFMNNLPNVTVVVGTNTLNAGGSIYQVDSYIIHPLFNVLYYAAGLANTTTPIVYSIKVQPITLTNLVPFDGVVAVIAGWGVNESSSALPVNELNTLNTITINFTECKNRFSQIINLGSTNICTFVEHAGACRFDNGGPLTVCNMQVGIALTSTCGRNLPDVHTKISSIYDWIMSII
ncbi:hypothetical protein RN001_011213 [Aquatica leii]|uniref:Peptidase S1 domain-containing protein n=1 Tax=Aquatica leii TaxID=1421715 RepID=A0AAN7PXJ8_9COLE|nr:hypothetical protein RN001_011213 [Aquatica leii]